MSTNGRKGNRSSIPARGGVRRGNTQPPPAVRPAESDPISTSRPRGNEGAIPVLDKPPADIVAAAKAAQAPEVEPTAKTPAVAPAPIPPARDVLPTLQSRPEVDAPVMSQPAPSVGPRSLTLTGAPGGVRRKGRGSNLKIPSRSSAPPPPSAVETAAAPAVEGKVAAPPPQAPAEDAPVSSRATVPVAIVDEAKPVAEPPTSAPPPSDLDERFFARAGDHSDAHDGADLDDGYDERMAQKNSPAARARREKNWMYIRWAAGVCLGIMGVVLVQHATSRSDAPEPLPVITVPARTAPAPSAAHAAEPAAEPSAGQPVAAASAGPSASAALIPVAIPTATTDDLPAASGAPPGTPPSASAKFQEANAALGLAAKAQGTDPATLPVPVAVPAEPTEAERKSAGQEKRTCQGLLDQGAFAKAVEAGERSVALDPTDGEAWLLLGAAYQSMGKNAEARRSFSSCIAEAKKGPIGECRAMLR
jgi:hypothetical protein